MYWVIFPFEVTRNSQVEEEPTSAGATLSMDTVSLGPPLLVAVSIPDFADTDCAASVESSIACISRATSTIAVKGLEPIRLSSAKMGQTPHGALLPARTQFALFISRFPNYGWNWLCESVVRDTTKSYARAQVYQNSRSQDSDRNPKSLKSQSLQRANRSGT